MSHRGSITLQQLHHANHQQDRRPGAIEFGDVEALEQEERTKRDDDGRAHDFAHAAAVARTRAVPYDFTHAAAIASAAHRVSSGHSPLPGEHPSSEQDENDWPETVEAMFHDAHGVQQEEHAQADENHGADGYFRGIDLFAAAKRLPNAHGIGSR